MEHVLEVKQLNYFYPDGDGKRIIFEDCNISFSCGRFYAILGDSGSGKTTFLSVIAGLDKRYEGEVIYEGKEIKEIGLDKYRRSGVSMVFQSYNLIPHLNAIENCLIAMDISSNVSFLDKKKVVELLAKYGIDEKKAKRKVNSLSGGEQQRVAIVRTILTESKVIIADEPTGNLDQTASQSIMDAFLQLAHEEKKCVIMVTHNQKLAEMADVQLMIDQKKMISKEERK